MRRSADGRWRTSFGSWVARYSVSRLVRELGRDADLAITAGQAYSWIAGRNAPRPPRALAVVRLSRGALELSDVYTHLHAVRRAGRHDAADRMR